MPRPKEDFADLRPFDYREPEEVLDPEEMYTVYEIARLLQGVDLGRELDVETENVLLDWTIPWMLDHQESFVFAEPVAEDRPGYYGLRTGEGTGVASGGETAGTDDAT